MDTPSDRMQVVGLGELMHPGACALCGNGTCVDGYVNTSIFYDYEGTVYLCMRCVEQLCKVVGALLPDEVVSFKQHTEEIAKRCAELEAENNDLRGRVSSWDSVLSGAFPNGVPGATVNEGSEDKQPDVTEPTTGSAGRKPTAKKSVASRRPNDSTQSASRDFVV